MATDNAKLVESLRKDAVLYEHQTYAAAADEIERLSTALASAEALNERLAGELRWEVRFLEAHAERLDGWAADAEMAQAFRNAANQCRKVAAPASALLASIDKGDGNGHN